MCLLHLPASYILKNLSANSSAFFAFSSCSPTGLAAPWPVSLSRRKDTSCCDSAYITYARACTSKMFIMANRLSSLRDSPVVLRSPQPACSAPAPCARDLRRPRCQMRAKAHRSHTQPCPQTTPAVPPSPRRPPQERQEHKEHCGIQNHRFFAPARRG